MLHVITDLGDVALLAPASAVLFVYLLCLKRAHTAAIWALTVALCAALTLLGKVMFHFGDAYFPFLGVRNPSGHVSVSTAFYGCGALLVGTHAKPWMRLAIGLASTALIAAVAASRILLHAHTPSEVVVGLLIGLCCVAWFAHAFLQRPFRPLPWQPLGAAMLGLVILMHGERFNSNALLSSFAHQFRLILQERMHPVAAPETAVHEDAATSG